MLTSGELKQAGKTDAVATLSEGQTIEAIGWNFGLFRINELQTVYCSAIGEYIASTKAQTGDFTLEGESIYASTSSRSKITVSSGAFSFESGSGSSTINTRNPMKDDYEFSIDYKEVDYSSNDNNNGDGSEDTDSGEVTAPDRPSSLTLTPYKYSILLRWEPSDSDGGSPIERYEYQYQSGNYNRKVWSEWSEWTSAGTGNSRSTWITGLNPGVNYGVRMRAYNGEEYSVQTGIVIVKTKK